jgi:hypothetical protein
VADNQKPPAGTTRGLRLTAGICVIAASRRGRVARTAARATCQLLPQPNSRTAALAAGDELDAGVFEHPQGAAIRPLFYFLHVAVPSHSHVGAAAEPV